MSLIWASVIGFPWSFSSLLGPQPLALAIYHGWLVTWELRKWFDNSSASLCLWRYRFWVGCSVWGLHSAATLSVISCSVLPRSFHLWFQVAGIMPSAAGGDPPMSLGGQRACYFSQSWWLISIKSLMRALCDRCARSPPLNRHRFIGCVGEGISSSLLNLFWRFYDILLTLFWRFSGAFLALSWRFSGVFLQALNNWGWGFFFSPLSPNSSRLIGYFYDSVAFLWTALSTERNLRVIIERFLIKIIILDFNVLRGFNWTCVCWGNNCSGRCVFILAFNERKASTFLEDEN